MSYDYDPLDRKQFEPHKQAIFAAINTKNAPEVDKLLGNDLLSALKSESDFKKIASSIALVLEAKNKRYGNSALDPILVFNGKTKVGQRADDKIARIKNSEVLRKNDICDLIGYLILMCKENNWTDFSDQID